MAVESAAKGREPLIDDSEAGTSEPRTTGSPHPTRWGAWAGLFGGLLWVLFPLGELPLAHLVVTPEGFLAYYGLGYLCATLFLLMGLRGFHAIHSRSYGWLGGVGFFVSFVALVLVFVGGGLQMTKMASPGTAAYLILIVGFFILVWGSALLGLAITGTLRDPPLYLGGLLLTIAVPLGFLFTFEAGAAWSFGVWVGLTVPYGVAWMVLGYALLRARGPAAQPSRQRLRERS